ncbi:hypothetical protein [Streptococcus halichoeri]|uniref:hypothetical protein n=1 Tax=Streptococcus halichoeri TaxID=254785 RepID=UPI00135C2CB2|nr:hypothetical protein [Streptococcus halichoeri]
MKKLLMVVAMCLAFCAVAVNADGRKWEKVPDQQKVTDDGGGEIPVSIDGDNKITVTLPKGWSMWLEGKPPHTPIKVNNKPLTDYQKPSETIPRDGVQGSSNTSPKVIVSDEKENPKLRLIYNDNRGEAGLPITVTVASPTNNEDRLTVSFQGDDGVFAGSVTFGNSQAIAEAKQKAEEEKLNEEMEKRYLEYVNYDNSKTWYQRLGDGIRDQWWNFTGMFY